MPKIAVLIASWDAPVLLERCLDSLRATIQADTDIFVALNGVYTTPLIEYLKSMNIHYVILDDNYGTLGVDFLIPFIYNYDYVVNANDDMLFSDGWDVKMAAAVKKYYPASVSPILIEPRHSGNPAVIVDNTINIMEGDAVQQFINYCNAGRYSYPLPITCYQHPIMTTVKDFLDVGGYSDSFDMNWWFGAVLDDFFPYRLWQRHEQKFKFVAHNDVFIYHAMSVVSDKLNDSGERRRCGEKNWRYFIERTKMTVTEFSQKIGRYQKISV